jgi:hypothetical protein
MIILDPTAISDATFTRASTGTYFDSAGVLQTAAADVLRVTYDPADLTAPPYALIEGEATNNVRNNEMVGAVAGIPGALPDYWSMSLSGLTREVIGTTVVNGINCIDIRISGVATTGFASITPELNQSTSNGEAWASSVSVALIAGSMTNMTAFQPNLLRQLAADSANLGDIHNLDRKSELTATLQRFDGVGTVSDPSAVYLQSMIRMAPIVGQPIDFTIRIGLPQLGRDRVTSPIKTSGATVTRAADIIGSTGTVLGSNVAEADAPVRSTTTVYAAGDQVMESHLIYESKLGSRAAVTMTIASPCVVTWTAHGLAANTPISFTTTGALPTGLVAGTVYYVLAPVTNTFNVSATAGGAAINTSGSQSGTHTATASLNLNKAVSDTVYWLLIGATNQRKMVDAYNNTKTENPEAIILTMTPRQISQGLYLGGLDANEVSVVVQDVTEGIVYSETKSLVIQDNASSFFNWFFKRIRRQTYFFTGLLPVYNNPIVTIAIKKPGGIPKCGMCALGPLIDAGLSQYGLSREIKDYSSSTFAFDGTSTTVERGYAKLMSVDISIKNELIDSVIEQLEDFRQRPVVYVGTTTRGSAIIFGKYSSFKNVIRYLTHSQMALNIQGTV